MTTVLNKDLILQVLRRAWTGETGISSQRALGKDFFYVIPPNYAVDGSRHEFYLK